MRCFRQGSPDMASGFEETLIEIWRQAFAENTKAIVLDGDRFPILRTSKRKLRQVDLKFDGREIRGLEQNPYTRSPIWVDDLGALLQEPVYGAPTGRTLSSAVNRPRYLQNPSLDGFQR